MNRTSNSPGFAAKRAHASGSGGGARRRIAAGPRHLFPLHGIVPGQPIGERLLIDKNPSLTFLIPALIRVFPEIKLLVTLRDPARCVY